MTAKYQNIQILRILSCLGVFCVHLGQRMEVSGTVGRFFDFGATGVYFFFIISGFVAFTPPDKSIDVRKYYINRLIRIVPVYYIVIIYNFFLHTFVFCDVPSDPLKLGWLRYFLFLNIFVPSNDSFWNNINATWTIPIFVLFFLLMPLFKKWCDSLMKASMLWVVFYLLNFVNIPYIFMTPLRCIHFFIMGIIISYAIKAKKERYMICMCVLLITVFCIYHSNFTTIEWALLFSILIISSMELKFSNGVLTKVINKLDEYTYTVYLIHAAFIEIIDIYKSNIIYSYRRGVVFLWMVSGTIVFSILVHELVEKPVQKKLKHIMHIV